MTDRRAYFFLASALAVILIQPLVPQYRWVTLSVALIYLLFALLFATANLSARREARRNGHI
jgi:thiol:disulfide interchange protein